MNHSSEGQNEGKSMLKLDSLTEDGSTDNERVNRLAAQNKDLNVSVPYIYNVSFICFYKLISII